MNFPKNYEGKHSLLFNKKDLWRLLLPLIGELLLTLLIGMVDSVMVANVSEAAVSGVSLVDTVMQLIIYIFAAFGTGGAVVAGQYLGSGDKKSARENADQLMRFSTLASVFIAAALLLAKELILTKLFGKITA